MNWFLDMCIIIYYANNTKDIKEEKTKQFVKRKGKDKYVLCCYIYDENLPKWIKRQKAILEEIKQKINNPGYIIGGSKDGSYLFKKDEIIAKKIYALYSISKDKDRFFHKAKKSQIFMFNQIKYFLRNFVDEKVIPRKEIDFNLKSAIFTFTNNHSDSLTLASGIQYNQIEEVVLLTGDKADWSTENFNWVFDSKPELKKSYPKLPKIKYIQNL